MLGGLSFFDVDYWERQRKQWYDKRLTRRQISAAIKDPAAQTEIVSPFPNLLSMGGWEKVLKTVSQCLIQQAEYQARKHGMEYENSQILANVPTPF